MWQTRPDFKSQTQDRQNSTHRVDCNYSSAYVCVRRGVGGGAGERNALYIVTYDTCFSKQHGKGDHFIGKRGCGCPVYIPISYLITLL